MKTVMVEHYLFEPNGFRMLCTCSVCQTSSIRWKGMPNGNFCGNCGAEVLRQEQAWEAEAQELMGPQRPDYVPPPVRATPPSTRIYIDMEGGVIERTLATVPGVEVVVIDRDAVDEEDPEHCARLHEMSVRAGLGQLNDTVGIFILRGEELE